MKGDVYMKNGLVKILWLISGILLIFSGIVCMFNPSVTLVSLAFLMGVALLFSGLIDILIFVRIKDILPGAGWTLADGIITIVISVLLFCNQVLAASAIPFIFGMWVIFSGIAKTINSFDLKRFGMDGWGWVMILGVLEVVLGFISFFRPVIAAIAIGLIVGLALVVQGAIGILMGLFSRRFF